jgi:hypothetical protein
MVKLENIDIADGSGRYLTRWMVEEFDDEGKIVKNGLG